MGLFLLVSQVCYLLTVTADGYVLFAANLEDFRNLAKKFIPEELAGRLTEIVSESSMQYRQRKDVKTDDKYSQDDRKSQTARGGINDRYGFDKMPERSGVDQMHRDVKNNLNPFKDKRLIDSDGDRITENRYVKKKSIKDIFDDKKYVEREHDRIDISTKFTSADKRYKTVQRMPSSKRWYDQAPSYAPNNDDSLDKFHLTTHKSIHDDVVRPKYPHRSTYTSKYNEKKKITTPFIATFEREMKETDYKRQTVKKAPVQVEEFEYESPKETTKTQMLINGRNVKHKKIKKHEAKGNGDMIFDTVLLNKNKGSYEELPEKDEDYFSKEAIKPMKTSKNRPTKNIGRENLRERETTLPISKKKLVRRPHVIQAETEHVTEKEEEIKLEEVKARTENLLFNSKEENATNDPHMMKGTGIPTRERYKMSSPDYYKKLPRIVEKYDFSEPIPEADREAEKIDDRFAQDPLRVNMKMKKKQQKQINPSPESSLRQFKSVLEDLGFVR